jgi:hypothetical protein
MKKAAVCLAMALFSWFCVKQYQETQTWSCRSTQIVVETTVWAAVQANCDGHIGNAVYDILRMNDIADPTTVQYGQALRTE